LSYYPRSRVEIKGFMARHYDLLLDTATLGRYGSLVKQVVRRMGISPEDKILDLGAGTGRNDSSMVSYLSEKGRLIAVDISSEMITQLRARFARSGAVHIVRARVDRPLPLKERFEKVFISFVLHGFPQESREIVIENAYALLRRGGSFFILDYDQFSLDEMPFLLRIPFEYLECPYAFDFIDRDWKGILAEAGFQEFEEHIFYRYIRLLRARKG
jgi:demethylmenaquinone methyltransferase/2-methoxy-6-polyprenyl-1,4-benzoquinol methylase